MTIAILESTTDGILVTNEYGRFITGNRIFLEMFDLTEEAIASKGSPTVLEKAEFQFADPKEFRRRIAAIVTTLPAQTFDVFETKDGRVYEQYSNAQSAGGGVIGRVWRFRDITDRKRAEAEREALLKSEKEARGRAETLIRIKDELLTKMSHDLRTPLNAILSWTGLVRTSERPEEIAEGLEVIERSARLQAQVIENILDTSSILSGEVRLELRKVDLLRVINKALDSVRPSAAAKSIKLTSALDPLAGPASADPERLQQVFKNLLDNAIKFTQKGGRVHVTLERANSGFEISISDTGRGISPDFLSHVFARFEQSEPFLAHHGRRWGLAVVKQLVELHRGSVRAKSPGENRGSSFTVVLPVVLADLDGDPKQAHPRAIETELVTNKLDLHNLRVLAVDDEADARRLLKRILGGCGAEVEVAESGAAAIRMLRRSKPDILLMDIGLSTENGYAVIKQIRDLAKSEGGDVPAIALTGFARSEDRRRAILSGFQMHIAKPVEPSELIAMVASLVGRTG